MSTNLNPQNWMEQMADIIQEKPIRNIAMAGIHHPASYSFLNGKLSKYITAENNIYHQLMSGIRYFDLRPATYTDNEKEQIVEYHGNSYGASHNTILRCFSNFFKGYNTLSAYGESPTIIPLSDTEFALLYHSRRLYEIKKESVFSTQLFYRKATYNSENQQLTWEEERAYNYGITPSAVVTKDGLIVEVHQSQNHTNLWYSLGKVYSNNPTFDLRHQEKYTTGVQPTLSILVDGGKESFLEVHKSEKEKSNNQLWFTHFEISRDSDGKLDVLSENKVADYTGTNPKLLSLPDKNKSLLFYGNNDKNIECVVATLESNKKITFSEKKVILEIPDTVNKVDPKIGVCLINDGSRVALSYSKTANDKIVRSYLVIDLDNDFELNDSSIHHTDFHENYITWNVDSAALFFTRDNKLLSLESDVDTLSNIWYQPLNINSNCLELSEIDSKSSARKGEFTVLGLSHSKLEDSDIPKLCDLFDHFLKDKTVLNNGCSDLITTPVGDFLKNNQQMLVFFKKKNLESGTVLWPEENNFTHPWLWSMPQYKDQEKRLNSYYFEGIAEIIKARTSTKNQNMVFALQAHLIANDTYDSVLDWNMEYVPISNSYLLSLQEMLCEYDVNIIENNVPSPFLVDFCCKLNVMKHERIGKMNQVVVD